MRKQPKSAVQEVSFRLYRGWQEYNVGNLVTLLAETQLSRIVRWMALKNDQNEPKSLEFLPFFIRVLYDSEVVLRLN